MNDMKTMKNMNKERAMLMALIGAVAVAIGGSAEARPPHAGPAFDCITEQLDLDGDTEAAVEAVVEESRPEARALHDEVREARRALHELLSQEMPDKTAVMAQAQVLGDLKTKAMKHRLTTTLRIRALLTPAQRAEMVAMRHKHRASVVEVCGEDVEALCPDAGDPRDTIRCLKRNSEELSDECREALPQHGHRHGCQGEHGCERGPGCGRF